MTDQNTIIDTVASTRYPVYTRLNANDVMADPVHLRLVIADGLEASGDRIHFGFEKLITDRVARLIAQAELGDHGLGAGRAFAALGRER